MSMGLPNQDFFGYIGVVVAMDKRDENGIIRSQK